MAKDKSRMWYSQRTGNLTASAGVAPVGVDLVIDDGNAIQQGSVWLCRVIGCVNVALTNVVIGSANLHLWHGVINRDYDTALSGCYPTPGDGDDNAEAWLWREPIPLWKVQFGQTGSIDDFIVSHPFSWQFRGGKGSEVRAESAISYVIHATGDATPGVQVNAAMLYLFQAS